MAGASARAVELFGCVGASLDALHRVSDGEQLLQHFARELLRLHAVVQLYQTKQVLLSS